MNGWEEIKEEEIKEMNMLNQINRNQEMPGGGNKQNFVGGGMT